MIRFFDLLISSIGLLVLLPIFAAVWLLGLIVDGSPLFTQTRLGLHAKPFKLYKFRTMRKDTPDVPSHKVSSGSITRWGHFLRRTKLDEIPQLINVVKGEMSLVGPRPCLPNQTELIALRQGAGIFDQPPGITGTAQILGLDMSNPGALVAEEARAKSALSLKVYFRTVFFTLFGAGMGDAAKRPK